MHPRVRKLPTRVKKTKSGSERLTIQAVNSSTSAAAWERVGDEARMASAQVQLAERAAAAARSRYRRDMAPAAAPRQAKSAGLGPGSAAPAAMPISDTTTSWFVICFAGLTNAAGARATPRRRGLLELPAHKATRTGEAQHS